MFSVLPSSTAVVFLFQNVSAYYDYLFLLKFMFSFSVDLYYPIDCYVKFYVTNIISYGIGIKFTV